MTGQTTAARGGRTFLKIAVAAQTLSIFFQAATAGMLLSSSLGADLHHLGSRVMWGSTALYVLAAILAWRPGGGTPRPILHATGFLVLASAQVALGIAGLSSLHVPLGVLMFGLSTLTLGHMLSTARRGRSAIRSGMPQRSAT
ncbi:hypothetical protein [Nonomuraea typhae]|uniref:hypothetical protein n=1 Tax=Nonomuraea typhae TaxID=2603600 RepID=UPI0012FB84CE|nr:hypothetical protein [Nonomuraea typhae]